MAWQPLSAVLLVIAGLALIASSFIWPIVSTSVSGWTQEQALQYQAASARLHSLSHEFAHAAQQGNDQTLQTELDKTQAEYEVLRSQLESAMDRPRRVAWLLRLGGLLLAGVGVANLYFRTPTGDGGPRR
jgi:hypothetical protein